MTCFDLGAYLDEAVESILNQTYRDVELIIVDDGSTDPPTRETLARLSAQQIRVVRQENQGLPSARNAGIRLTRGPYVCCLDADDRLLPTYLERAVGVLETRPAVGFVSSHSRLFGAIDTQYRPSTCEIPDMLVVNRAVTASVFRRDAWLAVGGFCTELVDGGEDWDFWLSVLERGYRGAVMPEVLFEYRVRDNSLSSRMYQPATFGRLMRTLTARHEPSYREHLGDVMAAHATRYAELKSYLAARDHAIEWLEQQRSSWQNTAQDQERVIAHLRAGVRELEEANRWLELQRSAWQRTAEDQERVIAELRVQVSAHEVADSPVDGSNHVDPCPAGDERRRCE